MATKRKAISNKTRFEVFKRDSFKCQYCGQCAPDVILNCDHINPVSNGGENELLNYITSCFDCNSGKSNNLLSDNSVMAKQRAQLEELNQRREQLEQMLAWREGLRDIDGMALEAASSAWGAATPGWQLNEKGVADLKALLAKFGLQNVLDAIEICEKYITKDAAGRLDAETVQVAFKKIGGVARMRSEPDWKRDLYYIRGIARNRFNYVNQSECIRILEEAYQAGVDIETLRKITLDAKNWTVWHREIEGLICPTKED